MKLQIEPEKTGFTCGYKKKDQRKVGTVVSEVNCHTR